MNGTPEVRAIRGTLKMPAGLMLAAFLAAPMAMAAETGANSTSAGAKSRPSVAVRSDVTGGSVIAWSADGSDGSGTGLVARVFNAAGAPLSAEILVNSATTGVVGNQVTPGVAVDGAGNFVVTWAGPDVADSGIFVSRFLAAGTSIPASEVRVNTTTTGVRSAPAVAMALDGRFVVAWESDQSGSLQVYAQWYDAAGAAVGGETALTSVDANGRPAVAMKVDDGETVVAWVRSSAGQKDVFVRRYNATGSPLVVEVRANTSVAGDQDEPGVSVGTGGETLVVWKGPGTGTDIFAQRFASNGQKRLAEFVVNGTTAGNQGTPSVSVSANGDSVVAWRTDAGSGDIAFRRFRADGSALSAQTQANTTIAGGQFEPSVGITRDQRPQFVIAYGSDGAGADDNILFDTFTFGDSTTVLSPSLSTESWAEGVTQIMKWGFTLAPASGLPTFTLQLDRDGNFAGGACSVETITTGEVVAIASTSATFSWTVPAPPGGCTAPWPAAKIRAIASNATQDDSVPFVVSAAPQIVVMRPLEGALAPSVSSEIRWNHNMGSPTVKIDLSRNGGGAPANYTEAIVASAPSAWTTRGNYFWSPTGVCDSVLRCKLKVCWTSDLSVCDESDPFNIATCAAITVNPATIPNGVPSVAYGPQALTQTGGAGTGTWNVSFGALPTGLTLSSAGSLSGTPTASGTFSFTAKVLDDNLCAGTRAYTFKVCPVITVNPATTPNGLVGTVYSQTITATGGTGPYTFAVTAGALPGGLTLAAGGALSGTPTATGTFNFTVEATAANGCKGSRPYTIIVRARPVIASVGTVMAYTENQAATAIESVLTVTDADSVNLSGATVQITANYANGQDVLACPACAGQGINAVFTPASGLLTLSNNVTITGYQLAMRSVTYVNTSEAPSTLGRTITWSATDTDTNTSALVTSTVNVTAVNDNPVLALNSAGISFTEGNAATTLDSLLTVADVDNANLTAASVSISANVSADDVLACPACAGQGVGVSFVSPTLTLSGNVTKAAYQTALRSVTYANASQNPMTPTRTISWQVNDGSGVNNLSAVVTGTITVTAVNDAPVALPKGSAVQANMRRNGIDASLLTGVTDVDNGVNGCVSTPFSVANIGTTVTNGTVFNVDLGAGTFDFEPAAGFVGTATVSYTVSDTGCPAPAATSTAATISIAVGGPVIWFVNPALGVNGDGRLSNPFNILSSANTAKGTTVNHRIFVLTGTTAGGTGVSLAGDGTQATAQWLIGQGATGASFDALMGITPPTGTIARPTINGTRPTIQGTVTLNGSNVKAQGFNLSTGASTGMNDGAAITGVSVSEVSITTGAAAAVTLSNTGGVFSFQSITSVGGTVPGITLTSTTGSFTVTGNGGTCTTAGSCTGGSISGKTGNSEATGTPGVRLFSVENVRLNYMNISGNNHSGIYGGTVANPSGVIDPSTINGFQLGNCNIEANGDTGTSLPDEVGVDLYNLVGTAFGGSNPTSITSTIIKNNFEFELQITNNTGTLTDLQMSGNALSSNGLQLNHGNLFNFLVAGGGSANMALNLTSGTFTGNTDTSGGKIITATGVQCDHSGSGGTMTCNVSGATFTNNNVGPQASVAGNGQVVFDFNGNSIQGSRAIAVNVFADANPPFTKSIIGKIRNNTIGTFGVVGSGASVGFPIRVQNEGRILATIGITGNLVQESVSFTGINVSHGISTVAGNNATNVTITGNTIRNINSGRAIAVQQQDHLPSGGDAGIVRATISGNVISNVAGQAGDGTYIRLRRSESSTTKVFNVVQLAATGAANASELDDANGFNDVARISVGGSPTYGQAAPPLPLLFAPGGIESSQSLPAPSGDMNLTQAALERVVEAALERWTASGLTPEQSALIHSMKFEVASLPGSSLAETGSDGTRVDDDAAGNGWWMDTAVGDERMFGTAISPTRRVADPSAGPAGRLDLLSVVLHEIGHALGLEDTYAGWDRDSIMFGNLTQGERRLPGPGQAGSAKPIPRP